MLRRELGPSEKPISPRRAILAVKQFAGSHHSAVRRPLPHAVRMRSRCDSTAFASAVMSVCGLHRANDGPHLRIRRRGSTISGSLGFDQTRSFGAARRTGHIICRFLQANLFATRAALGWRVSSSRIIARFHVWSHLAWSMLTSRQVQSIYMRTMRQLYFNIYTFSPNEQQLIKAAQLRNHARPAISPDRPRSAHAAVEARAGRVVLRPRQYLTFQMGEGGTYS
jgi:hypothetical protein